MKLARANDDGRVIEVVEVPDDIQDLTAPAELDDQGRETKPAAYAKRRAKAEDFFPPQLGFFEAPANLMVGMTRDGRTREQGPAELSEEWLRKLRDSYLALSDWTQLPDAQVDNVEDWRAYRQALRDLPATLAGRVATLADFPARPGQQQQRK